jgi:hypothetical protein
MKKLLLTLFLTLGLSTAVAFELPSQADFVVISESGMVVGVGQVNGGTLTIEVLAGTNGFAKLLMVDADGGVQAADVMVNADGGVTLVLDSGFVSLDSLAVDAGVTYSTEVDAELSKSAEEVLAGLPEEAKAGIAGAAQHRADAAVRAEDARANAGAEDEVAGEVEGEVEGEAPEVTGLDQATGVANENATAGLDTAKDAVAGNPPVPSVADEAKVDGGAHAGVGVDAAPEIEQPTTPEIEHPTAPEVEKPTTPEVTQPEVPAQPSRPSRP